MASMAIIKKRSTNDRGGNKKRQEKVGSTKGVARKKNIDRRYGKIALDSIAAGLVVK